MAVRSCGTISLVVLELSFSGETLASLELKSLLSVLVPVCVRSVLTRVSRPSVRPIVLPLVLPTVPRDVVFCSRTSAFFSTGPLVVPFPNGSTGRSPIVRPIREVDLSSGERRLLADCLSVIEAAGSFLLIKSPMPRLRSVRSDERLPFTWGVVAVSVCREAGGLPKPTAGCFASMGAGELRAPIVLPIRERWLVVGSFFAFEGDGVLRLLESPMLEAPPELAAGRLAPLGTDGLVVLIVLPMRDVMLGLMPPLELAPAEVEGLL